MKVNFVYVGVRTVVFDAQISYLQSENSPIYLISKINEERGEWKVENYFVMALDVCEKALN